METLTGVLESIIFHNDKNDYTIADFDIDGDMVTVTGTMPDVREGMFLKLFGTWINHPTYGEQFKLSYYHVATPTSAETIERYLASGVLPGIGAKTAAAIVDVFGEKTLDVLDHDIQRLLLIPGIGRKSLEKIKTAWQESQSVREVMLALQEYGIPTNTAMRLYRAWGETTVATLLNDPYRMIRDVSGIGFKMADEIAAQIGIDHEHPGRIAAGVMQSLRECYNMGSTCMSRSELTERTRQFLQVSEEVISEAIDTLTLEGSLRMDVLSGEEVFYPAILYEAEDTLAALFVRMSNRFESEKNKKSRKLPSESEIETALDEYEQAAQLKLDHDQREAVKTTLFAPMAIITGGPGTGKTTIINGLVRILKKWGNTIALTAPTGRAAKRMSEATGEEAKTIHRLLEYTPIEDSEVMSFKRDEENPLKEDVVIVDECSMVDILLMSHLMRGLSADSRMILVGDVDQLPSVGPGQILRDFINTGAVPVIRLATIYRQAKGSVINQCAHAINTGTLREIPEGGDVRFIPKNTPDSITALILAIAKKSAEDPDRALPQIITPMKKGQLGTVNLNMLLQRTLNPAASYKNERPFGSIVFREGDRVMQIKNDYRLHWENLETGQEGEGVYNGDIGDIIEINRQEVIVQMCDDGRIVKYSAEELGLLTHAWVMTIHKSQGSEFQTVVMPMIAGSSEFLTRRLLYTAVTRAKNRLYLIGSWQNLTRMMNSTFDARRQTGLVQRIENYQTLKHYL